MQRFAYSKGEGPPPAADRPGRWAWGWLGAIVAALAMPFVLPTSSPRAHADGATATRDAALSERERAIHVLERLGFGPRPGDVERVLAEGVDAYLARQLAPATAPDAALAGRLARLKCLGLSPRQLVDQYRQGAKDESVAERERAERLRTTPGRELEEAVLLRAVYSERQLEEALCEFWRNHLCVSLDKEWVDTFAIHYEEQVVRKHVFGRFEDMLLASARHPAMLFYLDNVLSQRPLNAQEEKAIRRAGEGLSESLKRLKRARGLNENYARELMELHTLGADNGYEQRDVIELARALTGWTVDVSPGGTCELWFREDAHDPDPKRILDLRTGDKTKITGALEGEAAIRMLARHKRTASYIAEKLVRHFVADAPPKDYVARVAKAFEKSDGDLREVTRALVLDPAFFHRSHHRTKLKTPFALTVSILRATRAEIHDPAPLVYALARMRQPIYRCLDPTGYDDREEAWLAPGALAVRWQLALRLAQGVPGKVEPRIAWETASGASLTETLEQAVLPAGLTERSRAEILEEERRGVPKERVLGLILGGPEVQRQ